MVRIIPLSPNPKAKSLLPEQIRSLPGLADLSDQQIRSITDSLMALAQLIVEALTAGRSAVLRDTTFSKPYKKAA